MSVVLLRDSKDGSIASWSHPVSIQSFYDKYWEKGIHENNIKLFRDNAEFDVSDLAEVMEELQKLKDWALIELSGNEQGYMVERIEEIQYWLPKECENEGGIFFLA